ncbi:MAG: hypothetical protein DRP35_01325 [Candidatus Zixiibacteriota bacterium]|nr:MAG: hypothetical protein DRP35_01325 [candidate division Zixibacteria bacterium]
MMVLTVIPFYCKNYKKGIIMKLLQLKIMFLVLSVFIVSSLYADVITETTIGSGYEDNLFNDSSSTSDSYAFIGMDMKYYPSSSAQLTAGAQYNAFSSFSDLSNLTGNLSATIIPTPESSPFSLALTGTATVRKFGTLYEWYNQVGTSVGTDISYRLLRWAHLQSSASYINNNYTKSDFGSNQTVNFAMGINFTVLNSNSITFKMDYSQRLFDQPTLIQEGSGNSFSNNQSKSETFDITGILIRYSRPLGKRTGLNLSLGHRQLHLDNDYTVLGYTIDYLSPWSDLWEGMSFSGGLKHFFPKQITTKLSFAYYDKRFIDVVELDEFTSGTYWQDTRDDQLSILSLSISKPILIQSNKMFTPFLYFEYRKNESTIRFFNYENIMVSVSLKMAI